MTARILVVCTGNVCRSPFVEAVLRARLDAEFGPGHGITVASRGTRATDGDRIDDRIVPYLADALARIGGRAAAESGHRAARLTVPDVEGADLIVTATREHRRAVSRLSARGLARTFTLRQLALLLRAVDPAALPEAPADRVPALAAAAAAKRGTVLVRDHDQDVSDPHGGPPEVYQRTVTQLLGGLDVLTEVLARRAPSPPGPPPGPPHSAVAPPPAAGAAGGIDNAAADAPNAREPHAGRPRPRPRVRSRPARSRRGRSRRARAVRRVLARTVAVLALVAVAVGCWVGARGYLAYRHLQHVQVAARQLKAELETGNAAATAAPLGVIQTNARAAHRLTSDLVWRLAQHLPVVGGDLRAAGAVARVSDDLGRDALPPMTRFVELLAPAASHEAGAAHDAGAPPPTGAARFAADLAILGQQHGALAAASTSLAKSDAQLAALDTRSLIGPEGPAIRTLITEMGTANSAVHAAARASVVLPAMFDSPTPKTYLLLFQNPAEARSLGGIAGAYAVVRADHGRFQLLSTGSGDAIRQFSAPVLPMGAGYADLFGNDPQTYFVDTTQTPYFPDAARLASEMVRRHSGLTVDGVIATDPVMLSYLLAVTGPVRVPGVAGAAPMTLTASNAVPYLLNGVYLTIADPEQQNLIFARTTSAVFAALSTGRGDPVGLAKALRRGASEGRLFVWDPSVTVTAALDGTSISGIPAPGTASQPTVGVYVDDGTGSKMSWYLRRTASLSTGPATGGFRTVTVSVTLSSVAPARGLPAYVSGGAVYGVPVGTSRNVVYLLAPVGGSVVSARVDGTARPLGSGVLHHRGVGVLTVDVAPGARHTVVVTVVAPAGSDTPRLLLQAMA